MLMGTSASPTACGSDAARAGRDPAVGTVVLVGAGPGDPGLITLRGRDALARADVVVHDRLVAPELLLLAPRARLVDVGKEQGRHPVPQERINELLVREARRVGPRGVVVRLKGGDPYLFGRGGEEASALRAARVPFEVVPGVTSALAAPSYAGIPVTDRRLASSVHVVTGHRRADGALGIDYRALARTGGTLVFLMAVATMPEICSGLLEAGLARDTPAAVVERGTTPAQRRVDGRLDTIAARASDAGVASPAVLVVGGVAALAPELDWFGDLPLRGCTVLVTRPRDRAGELLSLLRRAGARTRFLPCIRTVMAPRDRLAGILERLDRYAWLVLTSPFGVACLFEGLGAAGRDARWLAHVRIAVIGAATARALADHGVRADLMPDVYDGAHLGRALVDAAADGGDRDGAPRVLLFRSEAAPPDLAEVLERARLRVDDVAAYRTELAPEPAPAALAEELARRPDMLVTFTSPSTVEGFRRAFPRESCGRLTAVCLGATTARAAARAGFAVVTAASATMESLVDACGHAHDLCIGRSRCTEGPRCDKVLES